MSEVDAFARVVGVASGWHLGAWVTTSPEIG